MCTIKKIGIKPIGDELIVFELKLIPEIKKI